MPVELDTHNPDEPVDVQPGTNEAEALCFLYANPKYGFKPAEVRQHTSIPNNSAYKALTRLYEKDVIGKTADGYYHALDDPNVARYADSLRNGDRFNLDTEQDEYPDSIHETTTGFPDDDEELESLTENDDPETWVEPYPDEE
jgi:hypothetical protein